MNLHTRGGGEGRRQWCSRQNCGVSDLFPAALWHWSAAAGAGCWAQAASHPAAQSPAPAKTCHPGSEREGNTTGDTMVRGMWERQSCGDREDHGWGKARGSAVVIGGLCHKTLISRTDYHVRGWERSIRESHWSSKAWWTKVFFRESLISGIIR